MARIKYKEAAGIKVKRGRPTKSRKPNKADLLMLYIKESKSIREIAEIIGCSKDMVYRSLNKYGIKTRKRSKRSKLKNIDKSYLEKEVQVKGVTKLAKELSVDIRTLKKFI